MFEFKYKKVPRLTQYADPYRFDSDEYFKAMMHEARSYNASDVFIQPNFPVLMMVSNRLVMLTHRELDETEAKNILRWACGRDNALTDIVSGIPVNARFELFDKTLLDEKGGKIKYGYRVNSSPIMGWGSTAAQTILRAIPSTPPTYQSLGLSDVLVQAATPRDGIVYVAGSTGSGKTTTFSSIIRHILEGDTPIKGNIITHEEPIEFTYNKIVSEHSVIVQSQVPTHFKTFGDANREAMRRKPALIMIGEMRDEESIRAAVEASLTGHPVFGTVHATNVASVIRRLISRFPRDERATAIFDIIETARLIMAQRLVRGLDDKLLAAREYLVFTDDIRDQLVNVDDMGRVTDAVKQLVVSKGHSFAKEGMRLYEQGLISDEVRLDLANTL